MKFLYLATALLLALPAPVLRAPPDSVQTLQHADVFAIGGIGIAGTTSEGESALRTILETTNATEQLVALLHSATPAGQLYALLGLRVHDRPAYHRALPTLPKSDQSVKTIGGCIISHLPFQQLRDRIEAGDYDQALARKPR